MMKTTLQRLFGHWKNWYAPKWLLLALLLLGLLSSHAQADITNSPGQTIIIAAGGAQRNNTLFPYSNEFTQRIYRLLKERGFSDTDIIYMNPQPPDIDGDGYLEIENQDYDLSNPAQAR